MKRKRATSSQSIDVSDDACTNSQHEPRQSSKNGRSGSQEGCQSNTSTRHSRYSAPPAVFADLTARMLNAHSADSLKTEAMKNLPAIKLEAVMKTLSVPRKRRHTVIHGPAHIDMFSDEILLHILRWLPKSALFSVMQVCKRLHRLSTDASLWQSLDISQRHVTVSQAELVFFDRGVNYLRASRTIFTANSSPYMDRTLAHRSTTDTLRFLDLSVAHISSQHLARLLSHISSLEKVSFESLDMSDDVCKSLGRNHGLTIANFSMATGLCAVGLRHFLAGCTVLQELNIAWTGLDEDAVDVLVSHMPSSVKRLNLSGCRYTLNDSHVQKLLIGDQKEGVEPTAPNLVEVDFSDAINLTNNVIRFMRLGAAAQSLQQISLSRCYGISMSAYLMLISNDNKEKSSIQVAPMLQLVSLNVFGVMKDAALTELKNRFAKYNIEVNDNMLSTIARPTVGAHRTSIWGARVRD